MATIRITEEGKYNLIGMPEMKRRILTILVDGSSKKTTAVVKQLQEDFIEYKYLPVKIHMQAIVELAKMEYVEFIG